MKTNSLKITLGILLLSLIGSFHCYAQSVNFDWVTTTAPGIYAKDFDFNDNGDIYSVGMFVDTVVFNDGSTHISSGFWDMHIQKHDSNGNLLWVKTIGGVELDAANFIRVDTAGNLIIGGAFNNTVDFDPGPGVFNQTAPLITHSFLLKLDSNGDFIWAKMFDAPQNGLQLYDLEVSESGHFYVTGFFSYTCDFDLGPSNYLLSTAISADWFIAKYDLDGELEWANSYPSGGSDKGIAIAIDTNQHIVNVGFMGNQEVVKKLDTNGVIIWQNNLYGWYLNFNDVTTDLNNNIIVGGWFNGLTDVDHDTTSIFYIDAFTQDAFSIKYDSDGDFLWASSIGGPATDKYYKIETDSNGNIYYLGNYDATVDFDPGPVVNEYSSIMSSNDIFVLKVDSLGAFQYVKLIEGPQSQHPSEFYIDETGNIFLCGNFAGLTDFDPSSGIYTDSTPSNFGGSFIEKLGFCVPQQGVDIVVGCDSLTWMDGLTYSMPTNTPEFTMNSASAIGCDSIVTLNLTLEYATEWTDSVIVCEPYTWMDGITYTSSTNTPTFTLTNAVGCDSTIHLDFTYNGTVEWAFLSNAITVRAFPSNAQYQWIDCNNGNSPILGATSVTYVASQNGSYAAVMTLNGCTDTKNCVTIGEIGLDENDKKFEIQLFPNPTSGEVTVSFGQFQDNVKITLLDLVGKKLGSRKYSNTNECKMNLDGESGSYFLKIEDGTGQTNVFKVRKL